MEITIDKWRVHYISEPNKCAEAFSFLEKVFEKCDKLVTLEDAKFTKKIWNMSKESVHWDSARRKAARYFFRYFLYNSNKFSILKKTSIIPISDELRRKVPEDDVYLVDTAINTKDRLILTTDSRLKEKLSITTEVKVILLDDFLSEYESRLSINSKT
ncbi:MAG: hypothetical protein QW728_00425 [Thermoplasmata archaeon]